MTQPTPWAPLYTRDGDLFLPTSLANGPWHGAVLHGSAVAGLFGFLAEALVAEHPTFMLNRLTLDFMRPVPNAPLRSECLALRDGGRLKLWQIRLYAGDSLMAQALALAQYRDDVAVPDIAPRAPAPLPHHSTLDEMLMAEWMRTRRPDVPHSIHSLLEIRPLSPWNLSGYGKCWLRLPAAILAGTRPSPLVHLAMLADMGNGAAHLDLAPGLGTINADITLSLYRYPESDWIGMQAENLFQPHGTGIIHARLYDEQGGIGHVMQTVQAQRKAKRAAPA
ncbi:thioesterase family protein [Alcanivorax sp. JB21]|uniref:thioesterase family protein n=1 Tax=Alcanivorax limicola TaxID=2874102 RepID=UPI001CBF9F7D|nr:thioesterase family protein [Alcanivorax limicola]MBZ2187530.1 thioesterase family protein [Alcanivorax limicola]